MSDSRVGEREVPGTADGAAASGDGAGTGRGIPEGHRPGPRRLRAMLVHLYTASGMAVAFVIAVEIASPMPRPVLVFVLLALAFVIDASDGPLARRWEVKRWAPEIDGRTIDDITDYLTYTFLPLLLIWRMGWVPDPATLWLLPALLASLFGFANAGAKDEEGGFFLGFPSYWNVVAVYAGIGYHYLGPWPNAVLLLALTALTVAPVRFVYPNLAPSPWRGVVTIGGMAWAVLVLLMLLTYPAPPVWMALLSLAYPLGYVGISVHLWRAEAVGSKWRGAASGR
jgi:phosphatidylcholine synthase